MGDISIFILIVIGIAIVFLLAFLLLKSKRREVGSVHKPNAGAVIRDILVASLHTVYFPFAIFGLVILAMILRLSPDRLYDYSVKWLELFAKLYIFGWVLFVITILLSIGFVERAKKHHARELKHERDRTKLFEDKIQTLNSEIKNLKESAKKKH